MNPLETIHWNNRRLLLTELDGEYMIIQFRRVRTEDFLREGYAELVGEFAKEAEIQRRLRASEATGRLDACTSDKERERVQAEIKAASEAEEASAAERAGPEGISMMFERSEAAMLASIEAIGWASDAVLLRMKLPPDDPEHIALGVLPRGTEPDSVCRPLPAAPEGGSAYLTPFRVTRRELGPGRLPLSDFTDTQILSIGAWIIQASQPDAREVSSFRQRQ